jgi:outer membrane biosynthesis protein TonB
VVSLVVNAAGEVTRAEVIQNTMDSVTLSKCALSQIRDWKFPPSPRASPRSRCRSCSRRPTDGREHGGTRGA